jgi:hypothetical protein
MEKSSSIPQNFRITSVKTGAETSNRTDFNADLRQQDAHYYAGKLGLRSHGSHEGWIKAEEAEAESHGPVGVEARHKMIEVAAFYLAEKRGFAGHGAYEDWIKAEADVDAKLHGRIYKS